MRRKLLITNTQTRMKEEVQPRNGTSLSLYVCGITPYDYSHIGHGRCYVVFDVLIRILKVLGCDVVYVRNITDIDDKLLARAKQENTHYQQLADGFIEAFDHDMERLGNLKAQHAPRVTEHIEEIIALITKLISHGYAYVTSGDVYFDVTAFEAYGKLSGRVLKELRAGARVEVCDDKKNPGDFALWKADDSGVLWDAPWGRGRPGWHIECSALVRKYIGDTVDIHGGGMDLIFPHHENEIAQSESASEKPLARFWMHNAFVNLAAEKMSKSLGNTFTLRTVFETFDPMILRLYYMQHHYRTPIEFSFDGLTAASVAYERLTRVFAPVGDEDIDESDAVIASMLDALCDDLNTPKLLGILFEHLSECARDATRAGMVKVFLQNVLGLVFDTYRKNESKITPEAQKLIDERAHARAEKNWKRADEIRDVLQKMGIVIHDKKSN